ncbi:MAG: alpha/beta hydrolase domain-containing protein, partial [Steroidobacteraceae bacterium]
MSRANLSFWMLFSIVVALQAPAAELVPTPRALIVPASATNRPFLAAAQAQQPVDLAARGYVESELLVSGYANVYDWAEAGSAAAVAVRNADVPYTTRILVRRPLDARKFSGRVVVELLNPAGHYDVAPLWGLSYEYFLRRGDAWVGVTVKPSALATLQ